MIDRIQALMKKQKVNATQFAEEIGIQRSALSHVMSGRNNPSLDFMLKIKSRYPDVNLDWLLLGEGEMLDKQNSLDVKSDFNSVDQVNQPEVNLQYAKQRHSKPVTDKKAEEIFNPEKLRRPLPKSQAELHRIILLYRDGTFSTYTNE